MYFGKIYYQYRRIHILGGYDLLNLCTESQNVYSPIFPKRVIKVNFEFILW